MKFPWLVRKEKVLKANLLNSKGFSNGFLNTSSSTWVFIREWANKELNLTRTANDNLNKNEQQTAALRGRILMLKDLLSLPETSAKKEKPQLEENDNSTFAGY